VRLLDVPVGRRHGAWDTLHGHATGVALSDAIKRAAARHHGHAGPLLVAHLAAGAPGLVERLEALASRPEFDTGTDGTGQLRRAARRFALLALAGELATSCGATGWPEGEAVRAAGWGFAAWRGAREAQGGTLEATQIARAVLGFIERHGDARFSDANADPLHYLHPVRDRAGWWKDTPDAGRVYLFTADGLREALKGFDFQRALDALQAAGAMKATPGGGPRSAATRVDGRVVRLYQVNPQPLEGVGQ
jgi:putative DNA primase/helicase